VIPDRRDRIPDSIEPLIAYRAWHFRSDTDGASLFPIGHRPSETMSPWDGANRRWVAAACLFEAMNPAPVSDAMRECLERIYSRLGLSIESFRVPEPHTIPGENCSCGFYAMKDPSDIPVRWGPDVILGRVHLAGKVIEHELGCRVERARIAELIPIPWNERSTKRIALRLGLPLASAIWPWRDGLPPAA
jgi:hypothetical protein